MKSITRIMAGTAVVYLTSFIPTASAQMSEAISINLPVPAYFGITQVPAGRYSITQLQRSTQPVLEITSEKGTHFFLNAMLEEGVTRGAKTEIILEQKHGAYHATRLAVAGTAEYFDLGTTDNK